MKENKVSSKNKKKGLLWLILPILLTTILFLVSYFINSYSQSVTDEILAVRLRYYNLFLINIAFLSIIFIFVGFYQGIKFLNKKEKKEDTIMHIKN